MNLKTAPNAMSSTKVVYSYLRSIPMVYEYTYMHILLCHSYICLELFPRVQSMKEHDLANYVWSLFT
jgi:hypothetical protein